MAADIGHISQLLDLTLDPAQHRKGTHSPPLPSRLALPRDRLANKQTISTAEIALKGEAVKPQYSLSLLNIVSSESLPSKTRLAAALAFKNFIRTSYVVRRPRESSASSPHLPSRRHPKRSIRKILNVVRYIECRRQLQTPSG